LDLGKIKAKFEQKLLDFAYKITILHPQKHSISEGYALIFLQNNVKTNYILVSAHQ